MYQRHFNLILVLIFTMLSTSMMVAQVGWQVDTANTKIFTTSKIGIGTTVPNEKLQIGGASSADTKLEINSGGDSHAGMRLKNSNQTYLWQLTNSTYNNRLRLYDETAGAERLSILQNGNVGIGTTNPGTKFHLYGTGEPTMRIENGESGGRKWDFFVGSTGTYGAGTTHRGKLFIYDRTTSGGADRIVIDTVGKVGIGTPNPLTKLDVVGRLSAIRSRSTVAGNSGGAYLQSIMDVDNSYARAVFSHNTYYDEQTNLWNVEAIGANDASAILIPNGGGFNFILHPTTGNTTRTFSHTDFLAGTKMVLTNNGNVGIGTTTPNLFNNTGRVLTISTPQTPGNVSVLEFQGKQTTDGLGVGAFGILNGTTPIGVFQVIRDGGNDASGTFSFFTANAGSLTEKMRIQYNGNVGIGTTSPTTNLHIGNTNGGGIRIGKTNDLANYTVPVGAQTAQYNLDFSGYRDISPDQIGARISALRFNNYQANNALVQSTGLAFYTNPSGMSSGTTDLVERIRITPEGNVGIGTTSMGTCKLAVEGKIAAREVIVQASGWPDYVFEESYNLPTLNEIEQSIKTDKHLPGIPSKEEVAKDGLKLGEMQAKLLQKVEELTLYVIAQNKRIEKLEKENVELRKK